jgi:AcrR family transcriptional regulator
VRSDARRNHRRLLDAAREVMREQGLDASLDVIARRAGVGNATLYRHFPTREALYEALFVEYGSDLERIRDRVMRITDAWEALVALLEEMCVACTSDQAFADLVTRGMPRSPALDEVCDQGIQLVQVLLDRAQRQGAVRSEIELTDVLFILHSLQRMIPATASIAPDAWRRPLAIALDGLRPRGRSALPATAMTLAQLTGLGERVEAAARRSTVREAVRSSSECLLNATPGTGDGAPETGVGAISDELWQLIEHELPSSTGRRGRPWRDHRRTLEAILWRYRTGCPWRDLPAEFGPWQTLWKRHRRWTTDGVYPRILARVLQRRG